jgi:hypothetical protein
MCWIPLASPGDFRTVLCAFVQPPMPQFVTRFRAPSSARDGLTRGAPPRQSNVLPRGRDALFHPSRGQPTGPAVFARNGATRIRRGASRAYMNGRQRFGFPCAARESLISLEALGRQNSSTACSAVRAGRGLAPSVAVETNVGRTHRSFDSRASRGAAFLLDLKPLCQLSADPGAMFSAISDLRATAAHQSSDPACAPIPSPDRSKACLLRSLNALTVMRFRDLWFAFEAIPGHRVKKSQCLDGHAIPGPMAAISFIGLVTGCLNALSVMRSPDRGVEHSTEPARLAASSSADEVFCTRSRRGSERCGGKKGSYVSDSTGLPR